PRWMKTRSPRPRARPPPASTRRTTSTGRPGTAAISLVCCRPAPSGRRPPMPDAMAAAERTRPETAPAGRWIGVPVRRTEDPYLLTGRGSFVGDLEPAGTLHLALVRSYLASAAIEAVDAEAALSHPGVAAVITAAD